MPLLRTRTNACKRGAFPFHLRFVGADGKGNHQDQVAKSRMSQPDAVYA